MDDLLGRIQTLEQSPQQQTTSVARRLRWWRRLATLAVLSLFSLPPTLGADDDKVIKALAQRIHDLERKLEHVTSEFNEANLPEIVITGANLRIVNGLGQTDCGTEKGPLPNCPNGLGNLIVGYNESRIGEANDRTGSHNVVVGMGHNFSRFGGLVVGQFNTISGDFASVSGGAFNTASGIASSVSGGAANRASGDLSSVSRGRNRTVAGDSDWVAGGMFQNQ